MVTEIAVRFYLTIGFVAFLGLAVLTWTSSDYWVKRLGARWKRLQKWAYAIGVLAAAHFFMQSKADVSAATVAAALAVTAGLVAAMALELAVVRGAATGAADTA